MIEDRIEIGTPVYTLLEYRADVNLQGGFGLQKDVQTAAELYEQAAEEATNLMRGKQAAKFFEMAELAWAEME